MKLTNILCVTFVIGLQSAGAADFIVAPNDRANVNGNDLFIGGFGSGGADYNVVYTSANFSSSVIITGLAFRLDEGSLNQSFDAVIPRLTLQLSTYSGTYAAFGFGAVGTDVRIVYDGSVTWHTADHSG